MNLHGIVSGAVGAVNPPLICALARSTGYSTGADGSQIPSYATSVNVSAQVQPLTFGDLAKISGLNIQGTRRAIYINGDSQGVNRPAVRGGDLFTLPDATVWLVVHVLEHWPDWTKVVVTLQNGS